MNTTSFDYNNFRIGNLSFDFKNIIAQGGLLYPRLILPINLSLKKTDVNDSKLPRFIITTVLSELFVEGISFKIADSIPILSCFEFLKTYDLDRTFSFDFPLDNQKLKAIEASRTGDIEFKLTISFQIAIQSVLNPNAEDLDKIYFIDNFQSQSLQLQIEIPQSHWIKNVLPNLGQGEFFVIELPKGDKTIEKAWELLEEAELSFGNWNSKGVFGNCREIGVHLDLRIKLKFGKDSFTYSERWGRAYGNFKHWASLDLHLEDNGQSQKKYSAEELKTQKIDAQHLILNSKLLIKYAEELLNEQT